MQKPQNPCLAIQLLCIRNYTFDSFFRILLLLSAHLQKIKNRKLGKIGFLLIAGFHRTLKTLNYVEFRNLNLETSKITLNSLKTL